MIQVSGFVRSETRKIYMLRYIVMDTTIYSSGHNSGINAYFTAAQAKTIQLCAPLEVKCMGLSVDLSFLHRRISLQATALQGMSFYIFTKFKT